MLMPEITPQATTAVTTATAAAANRTTGVASGRRGRPTGGRRSLGGLWFGLRLISLKDYVGKATVAFPVLCIGYTMT